MADDLEIGSVEAEEAAERRRTFPSDDNAEVDTAIYCGEKVTHGAVLGLGGGAAGHAPTGGGGGYLRGGERGDASCSQLQAETVGALAG